MIVLLDTTVLIDRTRGKNLHPLEELVQQGHSLSTSTVNVGEVYAGIRPSEAEGVARPLAEMECYPVTLEIGRRAGLLINAWKRQGRTLKLPDMLIAATAIEHGFALMTDNRKDFPMPELTFYPPA